MDVNEIVKRVKNQGRHLNQPSAKSAVQGWAEELPTDATAEKNQQPGFSIGQDGLLQTPDGRTTRMSSAILS